MMETTETTTTTTTTGERVGEGLGLVHQKMARTEMFPFRMMQALPSNSIGPTFYNGSECRLRSDLYDVAGATRTLLPFTTALRSPGSSSRGGVGMVRFPFTSAQWQELEQQALIYKYMMASMPVPPDLLIPICSRTLAGVSAPLASQTTLGRSGCFNLRFSNGIDPEPGRCRRTDGKKWRCSRDVAPDQKYCERHMHRGRPRSRKPVEVPTQTHNRSTPTNPDANAALSNLATTTAASTQLVPKAFHQTSGYFSKPDCKLSSPSMIASAAEKEPRYLDSMDSNQQWQPMHANVGIRTSSNGGTTAPLLQHPYEDQLKLNFADFGSVGSVAEQNDQCCLYLNNDLTSLDDPCSDQRQPPSRRFIDAWSITSRENPTTNSQSNKALPKDKKRSISSLTLSMPSGDGTTGEDMDQIEMGLGVCDSEHNNGSLKPSSSSWINPIPWLSSPPLGGPLGEVLQSTAGAGSNSASPHGCGLNLMTDGWGDGSNPIERNSRLDSSPSCVLQRTLVSPSDSSTSSSPTFAAAKSEIALQWLCQGKLSS